MDKHVKLSMIVTGGLAIALVVWISLQDGFHALCAGLRVVISQF